MEKADVGTDLVPEILDIVELLVKYGVIEESQYDYGKSGLRQADIIVIMSPHPLTPSPHRRGGTFFPRGFAPRAPLSQIKSHVVHKSGAD